MLDAAFISDLHLHPNESLINARFDAFIDWAAANTQNLYILGDFFHAWPGDDGIDPWSLAIAKRLFWLSQRINIYYLHGNRDFLLGQKFARAAGMTIYTDPTIIHLDEPVMLTHGDRYCIKDKAHQRFRRVTRNRYFQKFFLSLPFLFRKRIVLKVRERSQINKKTEEEMDVVLEAMLEHMNKQQVKTIIHGHTHKPALINHLYNEGNYSQFILSDWDNKPNILIYDKLTGFKFIYPV
jgi:UDP-2,3-diacylglucosamine hydrolase